MATVCLTSSTSTRLSKPERTRPFIVSADEREGEQNAAAQDKLPAWRSVASPVLVAAHTNMGICGYNEARPDEPSKQSTLVVETDIDHSVRQRNHSS